MAASIPILVLSVDRSNIQCMGSMQIYGNEFVYDLYWIHWLYKCLKISKIHFYVVRVQTL